MHKQIFCQNLLESALKNSIHAKRKQCLVRFLSDLMDYDTTLSVTEIGKKLTSKSTVKSKIYAASTLVNNFKLERHILCIYKGLAHFFWDKASDIVVLIDWTGACSKGYHVLQASIANPLQLGKVKLGKTKKAVRGYLYTYKERLSKVKQKKRSPYPDVNKAFSQYYRKGWVIFSSINKPARFLVKYYKKRMQIEQNFRDIKNEQLGLGLRRNQSAKKTPTNMLFFLGTLLIIIAWWFGLMLESLNKHLAYQANSIKYKRIRSFVHLGRMAFRHEPHLLEWNLFLKIISELQLQYHLFIEVGFLMDCTKL